MKHEETKEDHNAASGYPLLGDVADSEYYIDCIGVDERQHICKPNDNICLCGMSVKTKKIQRYDYLRLNCYECTW